MDRLQLALRRYKQIVPEAAQHADLPLRDLRVWLDEDVNSILDEYARRQAFREHASWPIRALRPNAETPERELVDRIDAESVRCAKAVCKLTRQKTLCRAIFELFPPNPMIVAETVAISNRGVERRDAKPETVDETESELNCAAAIAGRWWTDLVNVNDYFEPQQEFVRDESDLPIQCAEWIVSINPELLPVGNFVVRCLLKRVKLLVATLKSTIRKSHAALQQVRPKYRKDREEVDDSWATLSQSVKDLNQALKTGSDVRIRDACVVAAQIYAAFHPAPDLSWLGLASAVVKDGALMLKSRTIQLQNAEMFDRVAAALGNLAYLYEGHDPRRPEIEEAVAGGGLVIVEASHEVYWQQKPLKKLPDRHWIFLVALARKAPLGAAVDFRDVFGNTDVSTSAISTAWGRLKARLPASLSKLVEPGELPGTYRLVLDGHLIHFY